MSVLRFILIHIFRHSDRIQSECGKIRTRITPNTYTFYAVEDFIKSIFVINIIAHIVNTARVVFFSYFFLFLFKKLASSFLLHILGFINFLFLNFCLWTSNFQNQPYRGLSDNNGSCRRRLLLLFCIFFSLASIL